mgnify:CR=1 FL=1
MFSSTYDDSQRVCVLWLDITSKTEPWICLDEAVEMRPATMRTVGWIIEDTPDYITIASTIDTTDDLVGDVNCIPRGVIVEIRHITKND